MKKILVFYSKTGAGHLRAAQALKEEIEAQKKGVEVILHEGLERARFGIKVNPSATHVLLSQELLWLFNFFYTVTNNKLGVKILRSTIKWVWGKNIENLIQKERPDLIITTHHHISPSTIYKYTSVVPFLTIVTDLGNPHILWFDKEASRIITPTETIAAFARDVIGSKDKLVISIDYPLKNYFSPIQKLGFSSTILVLGGGSGGGNILNQIKILLKTSPDKKIIVVCGNNKKLFNSLRKINNANLEVHGFVDHIIELYIQSDIVISKAGPGTIVESATLKKPLIITSWIGMQEKANVDFVVDNSLGVYQPNIKKLPAAVEEIYKNYDRYSQGQKFFNQGTKKIVAYILKEFA